MDLMEVDSFINSSLIEVLPKTKYYSSMVYCFAVVDYFEMDDLL